MIAVGITEEKLVDAALHAEQIAGLTFFGYLHNLLVERIG